MIRAGLIMLVLAIATIAYPSVTWTQHKWMPVDVPLSFDRKTEVRVPFTVGIRSSYEVRIDLRRNLPFERLERVRAKLSGEPVDIRFSSARKERVPQIKCVVTCEGKDVLLPNAGGYWGETVGAVVGEFIGEPGRRYVVQVKVTDPVPELRVLEPHLKIAVDPIVSKKHVVTGALLQLGGIGLGVISMVVLIIGACLPNKKN